MRVKGRGQGTRGGARGHGGTRTWARVCARAAPWARGCRADGHTRVQELRYGFVYTRVQELPGGQGHMGRSCHTQGNTRVQELPPGQ